ncbi:protein kinase [Sansalvadorimonas sp. 2012CJ34-2]|uniref:Protein kinase n=1 Tax=Parendozoicomonas callyspongiae TaxID=2942213 RepID=A0ABT0PKB7_9GAMM|nr:protein kinase [Sansalvadorimonas sp. 2012CJ34-2]MCL6271835.1 protein kinase [Sansalvadorimonas sp. 2012CJ34-2]
MPIDPTRPASQTSSTLAPRHSDIPEKIIEKSGQRSVISTTNKSPLSETDPGYSSDENNRSISSRTTSTSASDFSDTLGSAGSLDDLTFISPQSDNPHFDFSREYQLDKVPFAQGNYGRIYRVTQEKKLPEDKQQTDQNNQTQEKTHNTFALKVAFPKYNLDDEQQIMEQLPPHKNIVGYEGYITLGDKAGLMYEYIDGPKLGLLVDDLCTSGLPADELFNAWKFVSQGQFKSVDHVHKSGLVHCDLKPDNFHILKSNKDSKLLDFGASVRIGDPVFCAHESYTAPEALDSLLKGKEAGIPADPSMDCYALGQMLYRDLTALQGESGNAFIAGADTSGHPPGERGARVHLIKKAMENYSSPNKDGSYKTALPAPSPEVTDEDLNRESVRLSRQELIGSGSERLDTWEPEGFEAFHESAVRFKQESVLLTDLINGLMHPDPKHRTTAAQALEHPWFTTNPVDEEKAIKTLSRIMV